MDVCHIAIESGIADVLIEESSCRAAALALRPLLDHLVTGARFWLADRLRERVLRSVGETP